eukprot:m.93118 g.93118  ORF g.93118 m.93118 type:complete len:75 (-) comp13383_c0_seq3:576-800(-)
MRRSKAVLILAFVIIAAIFYFDILNSSKGNVSHVHEEHIDVTVAKPEVDSTRAHCSNVEEQVNLLSVQDSMVTR